MVAAVVAEAVGVVAAVETEVREEEVRVRRREEIWQVRKQHQPCHHRQTRRRRGVYRLR